MKRWSWMTLVGTLIVALGVGHGRAEEKDIVETAIDAGSFKTLAAALEAADLVSALQGDGPFTVFAPTDEAFGKLPEGTVETLLKPENKARLTAILTYHVVAGRVPASKVVDMTSAPTLNGQRIDIKADDAVMVDKANVVKTDIECSNGLIHVIDRVLIPTDKTIPEVAQQAGQFQTLLAAVKTAGLAETLSGKGPFTVLAPTDEAFGKLPEGTVESLLEPANRDKLTAILKYHVIDGRVYSNQALQAKEAETLNGQSVIFKASNGKAQVNKANLVAVDIDAANGVIHVIDRVLLPSEDKKVGNVDGKQMIEHAVARGVRLYNTGHHAACADLYAKTAREMVGYDEQFPQQVMAPLQTALDDAGGMDCPKKRAWALRHGLDRAYHAMRELDTY